MLNLFFNIAHSHNEMLWRQKTPPLDEPLEIINTATFHSKMHTFPLPPNSSSFVGRKSRKHGKEHCQVKKAYGKTQIDSPTQPKHQKIIHNRINPILQCLICNWILWLWYLSYRTLFFCNERSWIDFYIIRVISTVLLIMLLYHYKI